MSLTHKITAYLGREPNFVNEVILQDDGDGAYIKEWNAEDKEKPTSETLNTFEVEAQKLVDDNLIIENRISEYPTWQEQMDMQYWDKEDGTTTWKDAIAAIKTKYPKG